MPSEPNVRDTGKKMVNICGEIGLESGIDIALEIIHARWTLRERSEVWALVAEFTLEQRNPEEFQPAPNYDDMLRLADLLAIGKQHYSLVARLAAEVYKLTYLCLDEETLRNTLHDLFEWLLDTRQSKLSRAGRLHITADPIARLIARLISPTGSILDPACGMGSILLEAGRNGTDHLHGIEIVPEVAQIARMRLHLAGLRAEIRIGDAFSERWPNSDASVVIEPPHGTQKDSKNSSPEPNSRLHLDTIWIFKAAHELHPGQNAVVLLPLTSTRGTSGDLVITSLLDAGCIEAIIHLPAGVSGNSNVPLALWVLRAPKDKSDAFSPSFVLMVDAGTVEPGRGSRPLEKAGINAIMEILTRWRSDVNELGPDSVVRAVPFDEIRKAGVLDPKRFLSKAPVAEMFRPSPPVHLLSELRIENFKSFGSRTNLPLKPLTLLYGKNSSGKSSVLQSIQLLRQSLSENCLKTQGIHTDAGSFRTCVHQHQVDRSINFGLSFGNNPVLPLRQGDPSPALVRSVDFAFSLGEGQRADSVDATFTLDEASFRYAVRPSNRQSAGGVSTISIDEAEVQNLMNMIAKPGAIYGASSRRSHANSGIVTRNMRMANELRLVVAADGLVPGVSMITDLARGDATERTVTTAESYVRKGLKLASAMGRELNEILSDMSYLGPLRQAPQRVYAHSDGSDPASELVAALFDNRSEQIQISEWMQQIGIPYELEILALGSPIASEILGNPLAISLTHNRSGVKLSPTDVGFGVSQVLPILVELSARQNALICVEQPEIHLHPAMQAEMADLIIESVDPAGRANQVIAETHSEHLILRIQRRIREGLLDPGLLSVLYVDQDDQGEASVIPIRIDAEGDFIDPWPHGFFEERIDEVFAGL